MQVCDVLTKAGPGKVWVDQTFLGIFSKIYIYEGEQIHIKLFTDFDLRIKMITQIYYIYSCPYNDI